MTHSDIIAAIEDFAPAAWQETWDNTGLQLGRRDDECTGVLLCVDVTPGIIDEAVARGCNLVVSHHPLLFRGVRTITGQDIQTEAVLRAARAGVAVYSCHTSIDSAPRGVSANMAEALGATVTGPLQAGVDGALGLGVMATLPHAMSHDELCEAVKKAFGSPLVRTTDHAKAPTQEITRIGICGGSGADLIGNAIAAGAQAMITSDVKYHDFVDRANTIFLVDIGHYEAEKCTKHIFFRVITQKFPNFAVYIADTEKNPINYR